MPELPEVETVRRRLEPVLTGRRFDRVEIRDRGSCGRTSPHEVAAELAGRARRVRRAARQVSDRPVRDRPRSPDPPPDDREPAPQHERASTTTPTAARSSGSTTAPTSPTATCAASARGCSSSPASSTPYLAPRLGEEPLDALFTAARLGQLLARRRAPVKAALLDQRTLAGIGNIYVDEALWRARIHPLRPAESLERNELRRLHRAVRTSLEHGIARQGSTLRDYTLPDGGSGSMQHEFKVYGREGEPCDRCGTPIAKIRVAGRGTWFCPTCQPERRVRRRAARRARRRGRGARARCSRRSACRRSGSAAPSSRPSARGGVCRKRSSSSRWISSYARPLAVEQRLGADAVAAPARRIHLNPWHHGLQRRKRAIRSRR